MIKSYQRFIKLNAKSIQFSIGIWFGIVYLLFLIVYIAGVLSNKWTFHLMELIFYPLAAPIITGIPVFALIIILRFSNYYLTRILFYKIVKSHRHDISFVIENESANKPKKEAEYTLWAKYSDRVFRMHYSLGYPLTISLLPDTENPDLYSMQRSLKQSELRKLRLNTWGLTTELKRPFFQKNIAGIFDKLKELISAENIILNKISPEKGN